MKKQERNTPMSSNFYNLGENTYLHNNVKLLYITKAKYGQDWVSTVHSHHFTEIFYIIKGNGNFQISNKHFPIKENDLIIVNSSIPHTEYSNGKTPLEYIVLGINGLEFYSPDNTDYMLQNFSHQRDESLFYLKTMLHEVNSKDPGFEDICQNLLGILISHIRRRSHVEFATTPENKATRECRFIEQYINEHFKEDVSLQHLSDLTYLNKYYLAHAFKNYKGISPINYLIQLRISEAKLLLETTNIPIAKIATQIGFSSQSYFTQTFRKFTNMSPREYRNTFEKRSSGN